MPRKAILDIDHLMTYVHDADAAATALRRMGFTLSPISRIENMGISNYLLLMQPATAGTANFIELMGIHDASRLPAPMARILSGNEGIKSIVLSAEDIAAAREAMLKQGFDAASPVHVKREWVIGPDESVYPEFDVILPFDAPLVFNCCRYFNVNLYLRPEWVKHANGARRLRSVIALAHDPHALADRFATLFRAPVSKNGGVARTSPGHVTLDVISPDVAQRRFGIDAAIVSGKATYLGYTIEVASLDVLKAYLLAGDVTFRVGQDEIYVDPSDGLGNLIVFTERSA